MSISIKPVHHYVSPRIAAEAAADAAVEANLPAALYDAVDGLLEGHPTGRDSTETVWRLVLQTATRELEALGRTKTECMAHVIEA